ncbi:MAG: fibronectin type III domain-containing protein, partial [Bacteroidota bacterium]
RFFSGTMGDAFSSATGQYDLDYAWMFDKQKQYTNGYAFTEVKGPHCIVDLYKVLGRVGGKLVVTVNGFVETPDITAELVRFCIHNHIEVEAWQFCNEPYFYVPGRNRYWWNDGYDYALKMKPHADSILKLLPEAHLALNFTWDGIWPFMKEIKRYADERGRYWNVFSKHSYAPHIGKPEPFPEGLKRLNTKVIEVTNRQAMQEIEDYSWPDAKMLITEFGVWNRPLNGIISAIYNAEYTLRQLSHENTWLIGSHEISNKAIPSKNRNSEILNAFKNRQILNTDTMRTGHHLTYEGKALKTLHEAINYSNFVWQTRVPNPPQVLGIDNKKVDGLFALAFKGQYDQDYLVITNRSGNKQSIDLRMNGKAFAQDLAISFIQSDDPQKKEFPIQKRLINSQQLFVPPYSLVVCSWSHQREQPSPATRIYQTKINKKTVHLNWWPIKNVTSYEIRYGLHKNQLDHTRSVEGNQTEVSIPNLTPNNRYYFQVTAKKGVQNGKASKTISIDFQAPAPVSIFKTSTRNQSISIWWRSVPNANGYLVKVSNQMTKEIQLYNAQNSFGYRFEGVEYDVPYRIEVLAYNGLDTVAAKNYKIVIPKANLPIPARNISASAQPNGQVLLQWIAQDSIHPNVKYRIYRGNLPHQFVPVADDISGSTYLDTLPNPEKDYYYTVKAYNEAGESNFHPNIASIIPLEEARSVYIEKVKQEVDHFLIQIAYENIPPRQIQQFGIRYSNISYLNARSTIVTGQTLKSGPQKGSFTVRLPKELLRKNATFALQAFIGNDLETSYSLPPYPNINTNN